MWRQIRKLVQRRCAPDDQDELRSVLREIMRQLRSRRPHNTINIPPGLDPEEQSLYVERSILTGQLRRRDGHEEEE